MGKFAEDLCSKLNLNQVATRSSQSFCWRKVSTKLRMENRRGYAHNGWLDHGVNIKVS